MIYWTLLTTGDQVPNVHLWIVGAEAVFRHLATTLTEASGKAPHSQTKHQLLREPHLWHYQQQAQLLWLQRCGDTSYSSSSEQVVSYLHTLCAAGWDENCPEHGSFCFSLTTLLHCSSATDLKLVNRTWLAWDKHLKNIYFSELRSIRRTFGSVRVWLLCFVFFLQKSQGEIKPVEFSAMDRSK